MTTKRKVWDKISSKIIYASPWIKVRIDKVTRPSGKRGIYEVVELKGGIGVVPIDKDGEIYMVGQYRYAPAVYSWEIPKGAYDSFECKDTPLATSKKELEEETGLTAKTWRKITTVHTLLGSTNDKVHIFAATNLSKGKSHPEDSEKDIVLKKVSLEEFYKMVKDQQITDATTIAAVMLTFQQGF